MRIKIVDFDPMSLLAGVGCTSLRRVMASRSVMLCTNAHPNYLGGVTRFPVPDDKVSWSVEWKEYRPIQYTAQKVLAGPKWADPDISSSTGAATPLRFNTMDGDVDRRSHTGQYEVINGVPRNPIGRTGMCGRGLLGRWGPNHAVDPIVTRWKRDSDGGKVVRSGLPVLEFVAIRRRDSGSWALPGGMVEPGDTVSRTLKKEFGEEALNSLEVSDEEKREIEAHINQLFREGEQVYAGYIADPRNTDNAWVETVAVNFHDESGTAFGRVQLQAGDDASAVAWTEALSSVQLHPCHAYLVELAVRVRKAAW